MTSLIVNIRTKCALNIIIKCILLFALFFFISMDGKANPLARTAPFAISERSDFTTFTCYVYPTNKTTDRMPNAWTTHPLKTLCETINFFWIIHGQRCRRLRHAHFCSSSVETPAEYMFQRNRKRHRLVQGFLTSIIPRLPFGFIKSYTFFFFLILIVGKNKILKLKTFFFVLMFNLYSKKKKKKNRPPLIFCFLPHLRK